MSARTNKRAPRPASARLAAPVIRAAEPADAEALSRIAAVTFAAACSEGTPPEDVRRYIESELTACEFRRHMASRTRCILVAGSDDALCGYLMLCREAVPAVIADRDPLELRRLYVLPEQQGLGVADALMVRAIDEAALAGHDTLWLGVSTGNGRAMAFYRRHGFEVSGSCRFPLGTAIYTGALMARAIAASNSDRICPDGSQELRC